MSKKSLIAFCTILIFHSIFISFKPGDAISQYIQVFCALVEIVILFSYINLVWKKYRTIAFLIICYACSMCLSMYLIYSDNVLPNSDLSSPFIPLKYSFQLLGMLLLVIVANKYNLANIVYKYLYYCTLIYVVITDIYVLSLPPNTDSSFIFLFGNKFWVTYMNLLLASLIYYNQLKCKHSARLRLMLFIVLAMMFIVLKHADSTTGEIGTVLFMIFVLLKRKLQLAFNKSSFFMGSLFVFDLGFLVLLSVLLSSTFVQYFIVEVLHKGLSLNGRIYIYELLPQIMLLRPWFGWGCGNGYKAMAYILDTNNAQNGLIFNYLDVGIIGCIFFLLLLYKIIWSAAKSKYNFPICIYIYLMIIFSSYEITLSNSFLCVTLLLLLNLSHKPIKVLSSY